MATIRPRRRRDGNLAYQAEVQIKRNGRVVHRESRTFARRRLATEWAGRLENQLSEPDAVPKRKQLALRGPLHKILLKYRQEVSEIRPMGRSKSGAGPSTVNNDLVWLRIILRYGRAAWNVPVDNRTMKNGSSPLRQRRSASPLLARVAYWKYKTCIFTTSDTRL